MPVFTQHTPLPPPPLSPDRPPPGHPHCNSPCPARDHLGRDASWNHCVDQSALKSSEAVEEPPRRLCPHSGQGGRRSDDVHSTWPENRLALALAPSWSTHPHRRVTPARHLVRPSTTLKGADPSLWPLLLVRSFHELVPRRAFPAPDQHSSSKLLHHQPATQPLVSATASPSRPALGKSTVRSHRQISG